MTGGGSGIEGVGQIEWVTPGTYEFIVPLNVSEICCVAIGAGGGMGRQAGMQNGSGNGGGGGLAYSNAVPVRAGMRLEIVVGLGGYDGNSQYNISNDGTAGGYSAIKDKALNKFIIHTWGGSGGRYGGGGKGWGGAGGIATAGDVKFNGGNGGYGDPDRTYNPGAGGAAGYAGNGGKGADGLYKNSIAATVGPANSGAGAGSGVNIYVGGGVGVRGIGPTGTLSSINGSIVNGSGIFGAGGASSDLNAKNRNGAVRIIWGNGRSYPATRTADE